MNDPFEIIKNAGAFQQKLESLRVTGISGGGMVEIDMNGKLEMIDLRISDEAMEDNDVMRDLILSAFNDATEKVKAKIGAELSSMAGMLGNFAAFPPFSGGKS